MKILLDHARDVRLARLQKVTISAVSSATRSPDAQSAKSDALQQFGRNRTRTDRNQFYSTWFEGWSVRLAPS